MKFINPIGVLSKPTSRSIEHALRRYGWRSIDHLKLTRSAPCQHGASDRRWGRKRTPGSLSGTKAVHGIFFAKHSESFQNTKKTGGSSMDVFHSWQKPATFGWLNHHCVVYQFVLFRWELNQGRKHHIKRFHSFGLRLQPELHHVFQEDLGDGG